MADCKKQPNEKWLEKAVAHLKKLCNDAAEFADEDDVLPSLQALEASVQILQTFQHAHKPTMGLTVNGEISLRWENTGDKFRAYVKQDGSVIYFRNAAVVDEPSFSKYLTPVPA